MNPSQLHPAPSSAPALQPVAIPIAFPRLAAPRSRHIKRVFDVTFALLLSVVAFPVAALIAAAIWLESRRGPIFFSHERIGRGSKRFRLWKFRTMVVNSDRVLARHLEENPDAAAEWHANHKLRNDPRVTRIGRLLRRTSLDELPQLWNVVRGEMSLAGPRPVTDAEMRHYGASWPLYTLAKPGLTGLWQVSGRNDTTYRKRVELDSTYVRHWSLKLDFLLLFKTVRVVLWGKGAY
jgi:Undecaprenyl-phosphate galactose phosphotransferase WbaP